MNPCSDRYFTAKCTGNKKWSVSDDVITCFMLMRFLFFPPRLFETCKTPQYHPKALKLSEKPGVKQPFFAPLKNTAIC